MDELAQLIATARSWQAEDRRAAIATVIRTWGSAPRRVGSHLLVREDGLFEGSVSGGCVEGEVIATGQALAREGGFRRLVFGVASETAWQVGLACGGEIEVLVQALDDGAFPPALLEAIAGARVSGRAISLATDLATGRTTQGDTGDFVRRYDPPLRLMLVGAVHIAQALVPIARELGHAVSIVDPRGLFAAEPRFAGLAVDSRWPDEALADWRPDSASAVVTLTHDPKLDDPALATALRSEAYYIAALGSRKTHAARLERLAAQGFDAAALARIRGPAGLPIGAATPAEIALAIAAEMVQAFRTRG
ncbi:MAG: XdhC family protein [Thermaurantiacus tibetensis]